MNTEVVGVFRRCVRCQRYESIDNFQAQAKVCKPCMSYHQARLGNAGSRNRTIAITESGRELLRQWRDEEAASPAA